VYEICFIDDTIPVTSVESINDAERLNRSNLRLLLNKEDSWPEAEVRALVDALLADESSWNVSAFIHPNIYLNSVENEAYRPDIIIYDWEYAGGTDDSSEILLEILQKTYAIVYIYSREDNKLNIDQALQRTDLSCFKDKRLFQLMKEEENSQEKLLKEAKDIYEKNFSFRFGTSLRMATINALDQVLVDLGSCDIDFVRCFLADGETEETDIKGFITEKVRHHLSEDKSLYELLRTKDGFDESSITEFLNILVANLTSVVNAVQLDMDRLPRTASTEIEVMKQLWSKRIYYQPSDNIVRKGDVIQDEESGCYYLVITPDCDLKRFWHKSYGFINFVSLYSCSLDAEDIKKKLLLTRTETQLTNALKGKKSIDSLTGKCGDLPPGPFVCPLLDIEGEMHLFIGFPKEIMSVQVEAPAATDSPRDRKFIHLSYEHLGGYKRVKTIPEPFVTVLVQHCINSISGYGTPDYPNAIKKALPEEVRQLLFKIVPDADG